MTYFDGPSITRVSNCGARGSIKCLDSPDYKWYFNCGDGTNTKSELLGTWATLTISKHLDIHYIQILGDSILGDSKVTIDSLNKKWNLQVINIEGWKLIIWDLVASFQGICFQHIFRESNENADKLSKKALLASKGRLSYFTWDGETTGPTLHIDIF